MVICPFVVITDVAIGLTPCFLYSLHYSKEKRVSIEEVVICGCERVLCLRVLRFFEFAYNSGG